MSGAAALYSDKFKVLEYRPGHYVTMINGSVARPSTPADLTLRNVLRMGEQVDIGEIEVLLALTGVAGLAATSAMPFAFRILAVAVIGLAGAGSVYLSLVYLTRKIPLTMLSIYRRIHSPAVLLVIAMLFVQWAKIFAGSILGRADPETELEIGYLSFLCALLLVSNAFFAWVILSLLGFQIPV